MIEVVKLLLIFFLGAIAGWVVELFFRRFVSSKKWVNPGFLQGPYLPLYGFGLVFLYGICSIDLSFLHVQEIYEILIKMVLISVSLTLVEYIAGLIFIKGMKIKLWDYSKQWGNIQGIICPLFSFFWSVIGFIYYLTLHPLIVDAVGFLGQNPIFSFFVGIVFGVFLIDLFNSFKVAARIRAFAKENRIVVYYEAFKNTLKNDINEIPLHIRKITKEIQDKYMIKVEEINRDILTEERCSGLAITGFVMSFFGFTIVSMAICKVGMRSKKYRGLALAGMIVSLLEAVALIVFLVFRYIK